MKTVSSGFKTAIKTMGRQLDSKLSFYTSLTSDFLITELGQYLITESGDNFLVTEKGWYDLDKTTLNSVVPSYNGSIMKTCMKQIEIDSNIEIPKNTLLKYEFGVLVGSSYEYINYGNYIVYSCDYQADTLSYKIIAYDKMLYSMVYADDTFLQGLTYPITVSDYISAICNKIGLTFTTTTFVNDATEIKSDVHSGINYTYRTILDELAQVTGGIICLDIDDNVIIKYPAETGEVIGEDSLKDVNVTMGQKYGVINSLVFARSNDTDKIYDKDDASISLNGLTELKISDNQILSTDDRVDFITELFNYINGFNYYIYDVDSPGITYMEIGDLFDLSIKGINYNTIMLNDTITVTQGLVENLFVEMPATDESDYTTGATTDKNVKTALITVNKQQGTIVLKATDDGSLVQVSLGADASTGSNFNVKADNINLEGYTTINNGFSVDLEGNMTANNGTFSGDVFLPDGGKVIGGDGLLTTMVVEGNVVGEFVRGIGINPVGQNYYADYQQNGTYVYTNFGIDFEFTIPKNFTIVSAYITLRHLPTKYYYLGTLQYTGYSRNMKLYKITNLASAFYTIDTGSNTPNYSGTTVTEIANTFGASGFTGSASGYTDTVSIDIKDNIDVSSTTYTQNKLQIKSGDAFIQYSTTGGDNSAIYIKTGACGATLNIVGYTSYE